MENNDITVLAQRRSANKKTQFYGLSTSLVILASDLVWFIIRRSRGRAVGWWEIMFLCISGTLVLFSLIALMFNASNNKFNEKVKNTPLIAYDNVRKVYIVQSFIEMKEVTFDRLDVESVSINNENDEATLNYKKNGKNKTLFIGYADHLLEKEINDQINQIKADL